jgi:hypothetical protein
MPEHVHVHVPHELEQVHPTTSARERWLEIAAALMLSLATLGIAWSGYQAAKWSGLQARRYTQASTARSFANHSATLGAQDRTQDLLNFNRWLEVSTDGDTQLAVLIAAAFCMYNRMVDGLRANTPASADAFRSRAAEIAEHGYSDARVQSIPS